MEVQEVGWSFDLYGNSTDGLLEEGKLYHVVYQSIDADEYGEDVYPIFVVENDLELACSGDIFMDVLELSLEQGKAAGKEPDVTFLLQALNYYLEYDCYLDFMPESEGNE